MKDGKIQTREKIIQEIADQYLQTREIPIKVVRVTISREEVIIATRVTTEIKVQVIEMIINQEITGTEGMRIPEEMEDIMTSKSRGKTRARQPTSQDEADQTPGQ